MGCAKTEPLDSLVVHLTDLICGKLPSEVRFHCFQILLSALDSKLAGNWVPQTPRSFETPRVQGEGEGEGVERIEAASVLIETKYTHLDSQI